eukprot:1019515_1
MLFTDLNHLMRVQDSASLNCARICFDVDVSSFCKFYVYIARSSMAQAKESDAMQDEKEEKQSYSYFEPYKYLDETPVFTAAERTKFEKEIYEYFISKSLLKQETKTDDTILKKVKNQNMEQIIKNKSTKHPDLKLFAQLPHKPDSWKSLYLESKKTLNRDSMFARISLWNLIQHQTVHLITNIYQFPKEMMDQLEHCIVYSDKNKPKSISSSIFTKKQPASYTKTMQLGTVNMDCIVTGIKLKKAGYSVAVLNLANQQWPAAAKSQNSEGGTQEECLFKRSSLYLSLWPHRNPKEAHRPCYEYDAVWKGKEKKKVEGFYPMHDQYGGVYSKNVYVFRGSEQSGYALLPLDQRCVLSFIAVAARVHYNGSKPLNKNEIKAYKHKIRAIYQTALEHGHSALVLGALGCGIFHNPPGQVAELFYEILVKEFNGRFARVVFAILWDHNSMPKLVESFTKYFPQNDKIFD